MKALFSEDYYRKYWDRFLERVPGEDYINLEGDLNSTIRQYVKSGIPDEAISLLEKIEAEKLVERCLKLVKKEMAVVKEIEAGKASFGMMTEAQEIQARGEFRKRFEFNCLQLADFRKAHGI